MGHQDRLRISTIGKTVVQFLEHGEVKEERGYEKSIFGQQQMFKDKKEWIEQGSHRTIEFK